MSTHPPYRYANLLRVYVGTVRKPSLSSGCRVRHSFALGPCAHREPCRQSVTWPASCLLSPVLVLHNTPGGHTHDGRVAVGQPLPGRRSRGRVLDAHTERQVQVSVRHAHTERQVQVSVGHITLPHYLPAVPLQAVAVPCLHSVPRCPAKRSSPLTSHAVHHLLRVQLAPPCRPQALHRVYLYLLLQPTTLLCATC